MTAPIIDAATRIAALVRIYDLFDRWAARQGSACRKGCAVCCTQGVTVTQTEGERILVYLDNTRETSGLSALLSIEPLPPTPACTTNEFARACLNGQDIDPGTSHFTGSCPFLQNNLCTIYPVRPFSCRCFISTTSCRPGWEATLPPAYLCASTAVAQLLEHLDQGRYWGNLLPMLHHLSSAGVAQFNAAEPLLRIARPLPGFLLSDEDYRHVEPLLSTIFTGTIDGISLYDILNGKQRHAPR